MAEDREIMPWEERSRATYQSIGRFIFEFSQLEAALRHFVGAYSGVKEEFADAVISHDFSLLCTIASQVLVDPNDTHGILDKIISDCRRMNDVRVRVVHGLWAPFQDGGTLLNISRRNLKPFMSGDQAQRLEAHAGEVNQLRNRFETFVHRGGY